MAVVKPRLKWNEDIARPRELESDDWRFTIRPYEDDDRYRYELYDRVTDTWHDHMFGSEDQAKALAERILDDEINGKA